MSKKEKITWQNRIVGMSEKPAKDFVFNPLNWRTHPEFQRQTLDAVLSEIGWVTGVIENVTTGHLLDGHARIEQALSKDPEELVPFIQVKLSEQEEQKILAVLDPIGALATSDGERLRQLAEILNFESNALNDLMAQKEITEINLGDFFEQNPNDQPFEKFIVELEFKSETEKTEVTEKLARTVEKFACGFQNQERITKQISEYLMEKLNPLGVGVTLKAQHLCMAMRGVKKSDVETITSSMLGAFRENQATRSEFLQLARKD